VVARDRPPKIIMAWRMNTFCEPRRVVSVQRGAATSADSGRPLSTAFAGRCAERSAFRLDGFHRVEGRGPAKRKLMPSNAETPVGSKTHFPGTRRAGADRLQVMGQLAELESTKWRGGVFKARAAKSSWRLLD